MACILRRVLPAIPAIIAIFGSVLISIPLVMTAAHPVAGWLGRHARRYLSDDGIPDVMSLIG